ncbi:hypothetical protein UA17_01760 [Burkholderia multivorans]|nr:hypothetical protein UA17_01760 [Burkholderia multivorans]
MTRLVEMKVHCEGSSNHGKHVMVDLDGMQWNPVTDELDSRFVTVTMLESGITGSIEWDHLIFPLPHERQAEQDGLKQK